MFYQEYQLGGTFRPANELDTYCRLEGLEPLYIRSILEKERMRKLVAYISGTRRKRVDEELRACATEELISTKC